MLFEIDKVKIALPKIETGLRKYQDIMAMLNIVNVSLDKDFQKMYNGFYRVRQRKPEFYEVYYSYMEKLKGNSVSFEEVIKHLYNELGRIEPSFSSKLVATIDDSKPVWDIHVLNNLALKQPPYFSGSDEEKLMRIDKLIDLYNKITDWYTVALNENSVIEAIKLFDEYYPHADISKIKKIDLILWQLR